MTFLSWTPDCSYNITATGKLYLRGGAGVPGGTVMARTRRESKFEVFGEEMLEKVVAKSGSSGRVYLPPDWIGKRVKVIRVD
jgi:putative transposon-encoded protein